MDQNNIYDQIAYERINMAMATLREHMDIVGRLFTQQPTIAESAPPGKEAEDWIMKNKDHFKTEYGDEWEKVLYATAWKMFG